MHRSALLAAAPPARSPIASSRQNVRRRPDRRGRARWSTPDRACSDHALPARATRETRAGSLPEFRASGCRGRWWAHPADRTSAGCSISCAIKHPRPLASGKSIDRLVQLLALEQKFRRPRRYVNHAVLINNRISFRSQRPPQSHIRIELPALVKVHNAQLVGSTNLSQSRCDFSAQQAQQSCLAAAVRADQSDSQPGGDDEVQPWNSRRPPIS